MELSNFGITPNKSAPAQKTSVAPQPQMSMMRPTVQSMITDFGMKAKSVQPKKQATTFDVNKLVNIANESKAKVQQQEVQQKKDTQVMGVLNSLRQDIKAGMPIEDVETTYPELAKRGIAKDIYSDFAGGMDYMSARELYPELNDIDVSEGEQKDLLTIGDTGISANPIKQAGEKILELKEYMKSNPQSDPIVKTLLQGVVDLFDPTGGLATAGGNYNPINKAIDNINPAQSDNPITQSLMGFAGNTVKGVGQAIEGGAGLLDKGIAGTQSLVQGGPMEQYQTRQTGIGEDVLDIGAGATQSLASIFAMPASLLIGAGIETLPPEGQKAVSETMTGLGGLIAKTPGLTEWMESLPPERRDEFKSELAGAAVGLLGGLKGKSNIVKNPKLFLKQNLNPVNIAKNFNENVIGIPSKALDKAVSTVGKLKMPDVNIKTPNIISNPIEETAKYFTKTAGGQDKLFKAQNPSLNILNKNRDIKAMRKQSDLSNELIVKEGFKPTDTETRRIAHEKTMENTRSKVEEKIKNKSDIMADQNQFADIIDGIVADVKKSGLVKNEADIKALQAEAKQMRKQGLIDLPSLEKKKQYINGIVNNWGDSAIGDVYKNGMKQVTRAIGKVEDDILSKIPGEFSDLKKQFGALKSTYEDVLKSDIKNQKAKGMNIVESYSRIEGIGDIIGGSLSIFSKGGAGLVDVGKGIGKVFLGKALKKANDVDFLINEGFKDLSSKIDNNDTMNNVSNIMSSNTAGKAINK